MVSNESDLWCDASTSCGASHAPAAGALCQKKLMPMDSRSGGLLQALYDGLLLDYPLAHIFVRILQGYRPLFDELATLDSELQTNLSRLKQVITHFSFGVLT